MYQQFYCRLKIHTSHGSFVTFDTFLPVREVVSNMGGSPHQGVKDHKKQTKTLYTVLKNVITEY